MNGELHTLSLGSSAARAELPFQSTSLDTDFVYPPALAAALQKDGFVRVGSDQTRSLVGPLVVAEWAAFAASWDGMAIDQYMADGGRYRRRRHAILSARAGSKELTREPDAPHWQSVRHNPLNGGIQRVFEPIPTNVTVGVAFRGIADLARTVFDATDPGRDWRVEAHQFRIEAQSDIAGQPTPEGMHRDGVDWVLVLLIVRTNVGAGVTEIAAPDGRALGSFTLTAPMDAVLLNDHQILHGVTPILPTNPAQPAHRDVLVLTFARPK